MQWIDQEALCDFASDRNLIEHCHNSVSEGGLGLIATCAESGVHSTNAKYTGAGSYCVAQCC